MKKMKSMLSVLAAMMAVAAFAGETGIDVEGVGAVKYSVSINVQGANAADYTKVLRRNLELSGCFQVKPNASIQITGTVGAEVVATGRGKQIKSTTPVTDAATARMAARRLSDALVETHTRQKGFACKQLAFVRKDGPNQSELCVCYPDSYDIRQITRDKKAVVGPRWRDANTIFYTGFKNAGPEIFEINATTGAKSVKWSFKGLTTGAVVSPDGRRAAIIMSFQGNPELYVIDLAAKTWTRLTKTPLASEGQPSWSPDGKKIVYVSDETRKPQLYIIDVATKEKRRLTSKGSQNVDPDWGRDGRIAFISKTGAQGRIMVIDPGDGKCEAITESGSWEHPSWSVDMRHVVAGRDKAVFVVDTLKDGDKPSQLLLPKGNWIDPSWSR